MRAGRTVDASRARDQLARSSSAAAAAREGRRLTPLSAMEQASHHCAPSSEGAMLRAGEDFEIVTKEVAGCWVVPGAVNRDADKGARRGDGSGCAAPLRLEGDDRGDEEWEQR
jgi:hypothetical protein